MIGIRVDASSAIGNGHVMRCLRIARALNRTDILFICSHLPGNLISFIQEAGFSVFPISIEDGLDHKYLLNYLRDLDLLIVDHYLLGPEWEYRMRTRTNALVVLDDLSRDHNADLVIDYGFEPGKYPGSNALLGLKYAPIPLSFKEFRKERSEINNVLVYMGGGDVYGLSRPLTDVLERFKKDRGLHFEIFCHTKHNISDMGRFYYDFDLAVGAGGLSSLERAAVGLPSITFSLAPNQERNCQAGGRMGVLSYVDVFGFRRELESFFDRPEKLSAMSRKGLSAIDCLGLFRITEKMKALNF